LRDENKAFFVFSTFWRTTTRPGCSIKLRSNHRAFGHARASSVATLICSIISEQDREVTKRIRQAGELLGIRLDDHIIVTADGDFVSAY